VTAVPQRGMTIKSQFMRYLDPKRSFIEANSYGHPILLAESHVDSAIIIPTTEERKKLRNLFLRTTCNFMKK
jgi:hypothetical protein